MSVRQVTTSEQSLYYLQLDNLSGIDKFIETNQNDILTMRIEQIPSGSNSFEIQNNGSLICDLEIGVR